ncbi:hypothetical protein LNP26_25500 [Klebsiella variicola subsp. variicola]|nr:hypothetical protein [Klebsiella variicola subsp. variicola]
MFLLATGVIYLAEVFQTLQNLGKMGYLFRMLTWTIQASFITLSLYRVWTRPWFASRRRGVRAMSVVFCRGPYVMPGAAGALIILINQEGKL